METLQSDVSGRVTLVGLTPGRYTIESIGADGIRVVQEVEVLGVQITDPGSLALTGSSPLRPIAIALVLVMLGVVLRGKRRANLTR